jgi:hypothetical protein
MVEALRQKKLAVADVAFEHGFRHPMPASKSAVSTWPLPHELSFTKRQANCAAGLFQHESIFLTASHQRLRR